jgi:hypothetical protein
MRRLRWSGRRRKADRVQLSAACLRGVRRSSTTLKIGLWRVTKFACAALAAEEVSFAAVIDTVLGAFRIDRHSANRVALEGRCHAGSIHIG